MNLIRTLAYSHPEYEVYITARNSLVSYCLQAHLLSFRLIPYPPDFSLYSLQAPLLQTNTIVFLFEHISEQRYPRQNPAHANVIWK